MVSLVNSHTNATRIGWHLWVIGLRFAPGLPPGWPVLSTREQSVSPNEGELGDLRPRQRRLQVLRHSQARPAAPCHPLHLRHTLCSLVTARVVKSPAR